MHQELRRRTLARWGQGAIVGLGTGLLCGLGLAPLGLAQPPKPQETAERRTVTPPTQGSPGGTVPGGRRDNCDVVLKALLPPPRAGVPLTVSLQPTFFFYVAANDLTTAQFTLVDADQPDQPVYQTTLPLPQQAATANTPPPFRSAAGIISLTIPALEPILEADKVYRWTFSLLCNPQDPSQNSSINGAIKRLNRPELTQEIRDLPLPEHPAKYAKAGIWYDTLSSLAALRRQQPFNGALFQTWVGVLQSVGLQSVAQQPLVQHCVAENCEPLAAVANP